MAQPKGNKWPVLEEIIIGYKRDGDPIIVELTDENIERGRQIFDTIHISNTETSCRSCHSDAHGGSFDTPLPSSPRGNIGTNSTGFLGLCFRADSPTQRTGYVKNLYNDLKALLTTRTHITGNTLESVLRGIRKLDLGGSMGGKTKEKFTPTIHNIIMSLAAYVLSPENCYPLEKPELHKDIERHNWDYKAVVESYDNETRRGAALWQLHCGGSCHEGPLGNGMRVNLNSGNLEVIDIKDPFYYETYGAFFKGIGSKGTPQPIDRWSIVYNEDFFVEAVPGKTRIFSPYYMDCQFHLFAGFSATNRREAILRYVNNDGSLTGRIDHPNIDLDSRDVAAMEKYMVKFSPKRCDDAHANSPISQDLQE